MGTRLRIFRTGSDPVRTGPESSNPLAEDEQPTLQQRFVSWKFLRNKHESISGSFHIAAALATKLNRGDATRRCRRVCAENPETMSRFGVGEHRASLPLTDGGTRRDHPPPRALVGHHLTSRCQFFGWFTRMRLATCRHFLTANVALSLCLSLTLSVSFSVPLSLALSLTLTRTHRRTHGDVIASAKDTAKAVIG